MVGIHSRACELINKMCYMDIRICMHAGKTVENIRGRLNMRLCQTAERLRTYASRPLFQSVKVFGPDLVGVQLLKEEAR